MSDEIGDPLQQAAQTGMLGRRPATKPPESPPERTAIQAHATDSKGPERVKRTLMFTPIRARWLKVQAALEGREMSDIVDEALATYEQLHPRTER